MKCPDCGFENLAGEEVCEACHAPLAQLSMPQSTGKDQKRILEGTIRDLKPEPSITVGPDDTVAEAVKQMRKERTGCILIVKKEKLIGIFTERDLLMNVAGLKDPNKVKIVDVMKPEPQCLGEDDTIAFAFHNMALKGYRHIPILLKTGELGIISSRDLVKYLCK